MPQDPPSSTNESPSWSLQHSPQQVLPQPNPQLTTPSSGSQINPSAKPFIPAAVAPQNVPSSPQQNIPKSTNGEGVKHSRQQGKSKGQDEQFCFHCNVLLHCGCLSLNPFIEFRIRNNSSSSDVLYIQASISISPNYESK